MRPEPVLRIEAPLRVNEFQLREELGVFVRFDERDVGGCQLLLDDGRFVFRPALVTFELEEQVVVVQVQPVGNGLQMLGLHTFARKDHAPREMVVHDHASVAVQNLSARCDDRQ